MLNKEKINELEQLNEMQKSILIGLLEKRMEESKEYSQLKNLVEKVFGSKTKIKEIHKIMEGAYVIEQPNPFKKEPEDSDSFYEVLVDGKKGHTGTLSLDAAVILIICLKNGEAEFSQYVNKLLNIK